MRLDTAAKLMTLVAAVVLVAVVVVGFHHRLHSYQGQRELDCLFGAEDGAHRVCW